MFSGDFKETNDKEVVIEDTTYEAFKTFIRFLYCDDLVLKEYNDIELFRELYRLSDRYDVSRFEDRITDRIFVDYFRFISFQYLSDEDFEWKWRKIRTIARIAFEMKITKLKENVMTFIDIYFDHFLKKDNKELSELNDLTDGRLLHLMANKFRNGKKDPTEEVNARTECFKAMFESFLYNHTK